jgi:hypothetical protein
MSQTKAELIDGKGDVVFDTNTLAVDATNNRVGIGEAAPGTQVEVNGTAPYVTIKNSTEEDTDGGRESRIIFEGEQSGGEISTLAQIEVSHDGAVDDEKGKIVISTNDGTDGAAPTTALTISADQTVAIANNLTVNGVQYPTDGPLANRNLIGNGAMQIRQRGQSFTITTSEIYTLDRWEVWVTNSLNANSNITYEEAEVPDGFGASMKITPNATNTPTGGQNFAIEQSIEAQDLQHLTYGTAAAKDLTVSFYAKSNKTGTYCVQLMHEDGGKIVVVEYQITNSWNRFEFTIPGNTVDAIANDVGRGIRIVFHLACGPDDHVAATTTWTAGNLFRATSNQVNFLDSTANEFYLTGVQFEVGSKATPYEVKTIADDLHACLRYFEKSYNFGTVPGSVTDLGYYKRRMPATNTTLTGLDIQFMVRKRQTPTLVLYSPDSGAAGRVYNSTDLADRVASGDGVGTRGSSVRTSSSQTASDVIEAHYTASADF